MPLPRLSFSCECFYVALVAGQEKGIGKKHSYILLILDKIESACVVVESNYTVVFR